MSDAMREKIADVVRGNLPATREMDDWAGPVADAIIAALPDMVPPLVWQRNGFHYAGGHGYVVRKFNRRYTLTVRNEHSREFDDLDAAKAAANAHHATQIMQALGIAQEGET